MDQLLNDFSPGLFFMQLVILAILIGLLITFAWKPILAALDERENGIENALKAAENAKLEMANLQADNERLLKEARLEREALLKDARDLKNKIISDATNEAQDKANAMLKQAQTTIQTEKNAAILELKKHVASLSIDIAEKVIQEELANKDKQLKLVEKMLTKTTLN